MLKEFDKTTGIRETIEKKDGKWNINREQDVENILDLNTKDRNIDNGSWKGDMHKVASIPLIVWEGWIQELKHEGRNPNPSDPSNRTWFSAKINNRDFGKLRTKEGTV